MVGGHAMAAGLTIDPARLADFAGFLDERLAHDVDRARAGAAMLLDLALAPGTCMRVTTGAPLPAGADTVAIKEAVAGGGGAGGGK